ncbi:TRMT1-like protein [Cricetulus griseus]|nr:TRMT1-like protein [Cricetulus griseus]
MENMAEEELPPQEEEEAQVRVPTPAPDSAPVPAPAADSALDSAPTPDSAPAPALAPAPAPALSPSLASVPEEAESKRHISIQRRLADLEKLALVTEGDDDDGPASSLNSENLGTEKSHTCPLCPKEKFRACSSQKLRRHLQNLHWKISVEFEGYRMCICHLACRPVKPTIVGEQISSKLGAHYHCIICSATITRRTDMLGHVKRHVNKGETKSRYIAASTAKSSNEILKEADTDIQVGPNYSIPQKTDSYFNPKMKLNRQIIFCTLAALAEERKPLECLDAFGATENPYRQLPCNCHGSMPGKTAIELGPLWSSSLFNTGFLKRMLLESLHHGLDDVQPLIKTLIFESECTPQSQCSVHAPSNLNKQEENGVFIKTTDDTTVDIYSAQGKRKSSEMIINTAKKQKTDASAVHPPFYYNIHRHSIKGMNMPKLKKFLCCLSQAGFRVSRTHFDPMGIRTDAPLMQFKSILLKYSTPTYTGGQSEGPMQSVSEDTVADRVEMSVADKAEASGCRRCFTCKCAWCNVLLVRFKAYGLLYTGPSPKLLLYILMLPRVMKIM